jgi:hypothetical protein
MANRRLGSTSGYGCRAFTLYELLLVVLIIALLAIIPSPRQNFSDPERFLIFQSRNELRELADAVGTYQSTHGPIAKQISNGEIPLGLLTTPLSYLAHPAVDPFKTQTMRECPKVFGFDFPARMTVADHPVWFVTITTAFIIVLGLLEKPAQAMRLKKWPLAIRVSLVTAMAIALSFCLTAAALTPSDGGIIQNRPPKQWKGKYSGFYCIADAKGRFVVQGIGPDLRRDFTSSSAELSENPTTETVELRFCPYTYDPTNGSISNGDMFVTRWDAVEK